MLGAANDRDTRLGAAGLRAARPGLIATERQG
jgi:hypothetical protein